MDVGISLVELILAGANVWSLDLPDVCTGGGEGCPFSGNGYPDGFTYGTGIRVTPDLVFEHAEGRGAGPGNGSGTGSGGGAGSGPGSGAVLLPSWHEAEEEQLYGWDWPE